MFLGLPGLGTFSIGFLVSNYVYFIIRTTLKDPLWSIYDPKMLPEKCCMQHFYIEMLHARFV